MNASASGDRQEQITRSILLQHAFADSAVPPEMRRAVCDWIAACRASIIIASRDLASFLLGRWGHMNLDHTWVAVGLIGSANDAARILGARERRAHEAADIGPKPSPEFVAWLEGRLSAAGFGMPGPILGRHRIDACLLDRLQREAVGFGKSMPQTLSDAEEDTVIDVLISEVRRGSRSWRIRLEEANGQPGNRDDFLVEALAKAKCT